MNLQARIAAGPNITTVTENAAFPLDTWQHVAFTADGGQVRLYRNGQLVATGSYLDPINQPNVEFLSIGGRMTRRVGAWACWKMSLSRWWATSMTWVSGCLHGRPR